MPEIDAILKEMEGVVGAENVRAEGLDAYAVDGVRPAVAAFPGSVEEVSALLALASRERLAVIPWGGGTMVRLGEPPRRADLILGMGRLSRVIEYAPEDLMVSAEAGITLGALQTVLAEKGQFLPLDPPLAGQATIGGCIAANASGPSRLRYGSLRDLVLGLRFVRADGTVIRGGGKVVKNVAGYDLPRLMIGSLGTLGVIVEATFRLQPLPKATALLRAAFEDLGSAMNVVLHVIRSPLQPTALALLNARASQAMPDPGLGDYELWARFDAVTQVTVERQVSDMTRLCRDGGAGQIAPVDDWQPAWTRLTDLPATLTGDDPEAVRLKVSVLPTGVADLGAELQKLEVGPWAFVAHAGSGIVYLITPASRRLPEAIGALRGRVRELGGSLVVERGPAEVKAQAGVWGPPRSDFPLVRGLKEAFDPGGILNPGRFIGGI